MRIDIEDDYTVDYTWGRWSNEPQGAALDVHPLIFSGANHDLSLDQGRWVYHNNSNEEGIKVTPLDSDLPILLIKKKEKGGGSGKLELEFAWGGKDGPKGKIKVSGEVHDKNNNYIEGKGKYNTSTGEIKVSLGGGNKNNSSKDDKGSR